MKQAFEVTTRARVERAYLIGVSLPDGSAAQEREYLDELEQLAQTAGAEVVGKSVQARTRIDGATYIGAGKAQQIKESCEALDANLVIFDNDLSPAQAYNLEKILSINIIDRTELILDIFSRHAKSQQSKIQVELAQLQYALPRLRRLWEHLSRQQGGIGTRGPGETQLEVDRRRVRQRMGALRRQLKKVDRRRATLRQGRNGHPVVALVGYTNAGKSTLMQALTGEQALAKDQLFATLDTMTRKISTPDHGDVLLIDTVGFIRKLPNHLATSFKATLEDTAHADLYLHIVDVSHPAFEDQMRITDSTLRSIDDSDAETVYVFNKTDRVPADELAGLMDRYTDGVFISAADCVGLDGVVSAIEDRLFGGNLRVEVKLPAGDGKSIARVRELLHAARGEYLEDTCVIHGTIDSGEMGRLENIAGAKIRYLF